MKHNIYAIFDIASGLYSRPIYASSDKEAQRTFADVAVDADHPVSKHPQDYTLFRTGIYDDTNGTFTNEENSSLGNALEMIAASQNINQANLDLFEKDIANNGGDPLNTSGDNL